MSEVTDRVEELRRYHEAEVVGCTRCPLSEGRTQVVVGSGDPSSPLVFVGEAPGYHEDRQGLPFVGAAGGLLDELLGEIGLSRERVFIANVLKCRPPGNRDPLPAEIRACESHLFRQVALIRPRVIATLGNFATKLLSGRPDGITRVHGHELAIRVGDLDTVLYPLFHPAAVLRTQRLRAAISEDFARIPELLRREPSPSDEPAATPRAASPSAPAAAPEPSAAASEEQLGLF